MSKRLILNSASAAVLYVVNIVIVFVMSPVIVQTLGNRDYGIWEILLSLCGYMGILELGLGPAVIRYVAREMALENREALTKIFCSAFFGFLILGLLSLFVLCIAALMPEKLFNLGPGEVDSLSVLCILAGLNLFVQFLGTLFVAFLMGRQEHVFVNLFRCFVYSVQAGFIFVALTRWAGNNLIWLAGITLAGNLFQYSVMGVGVLIALKTLSLHWKYFSLKALKELYSFGLKSALLMVSDRVQRQSMPIVIGHTIGVASVIFYAIPKRLVDYAKDFVVSIGFPLMPYLSGIDALRLPKERMKEWIPLSRAFSLITMPIAVSLALLGEPFINLWLGVEYGERGRWVLIFLSVSFLLTGPFSNSTRVLISAGQHGPPARRVFLISVFAVCVAIPSTACYGINGAAFILMTADIVACWVFWRAASSYVGISTKEHFRSTVKPLGLPVLLIALTIAGGRLFVDISGYLELTSIAGLGWLLYMLSVWQYCFEPNEKLAIKTLFDNCTIKISRV